jgi:hypothetical protein
LKCYAFAPDTFAAAAATTTTTISPFLFWLYGKYLKHVVCQCLSPVMLEFDADYEDHFGYVS